MESFFLSETLKYLYLLFDIDHFLHSDDGNWVFSTEGHLMNIPRKLHKLNSTSSSVFSCKKHPRPVSNLFGGGYIELPLPFREINLIYALIDLKPSQDLFYTSVVEKVHQGQYSGFMDDKVCDARPYLLKITIT